MKLQIEDFTLFSMALKSDWTLSIDSSTLNCIVKTN